MCKFYVVKPKNFKEINKQKHWRIAMEEGINMIEKNKTWMLVDKKKDKEVIGVKQIYKVKHNQDGSVQKNQIRLIAKGYS